jgi:hypothetical protein
MVISLILGLKALVSALELVGNYKFWHSTSNTMIYDYSGNSRHASLAQLVTNAAYYTDRGLYIRNVCYVNLPDNDYNTFPIHPDVVLNFWYHPITFKVQRLVLIGEPNNHIKVSLLKAPSTSYEVAVQNQSGTLKSSNSNVPIGNI